MFRTRLRRAIGYARVSSALQALGSSLADQQAAIASYAKGRGLEVARFYVEAESSIRERFESRKEIQALLRDVREGDLVIVAKLDRWSRDPEFTYKSIREILEAGASFYAVDDQCDPSTGEGDTMLNFRVLFAREEHKRIRQRTVGTRNALRDRGYYVEGTPPYGYRRAKPKGYRGPEKNVLVIHEEEAERVRRMFALCIAGRSLNQIADEVGVLKDRVHYSLRNRHYLGELKNSRGEWVQGPHAPIVSPETFRRALAGLEARKTIRAAKLSPQSGTWEWILRDVARCARCGAKMSSAYNRVRARVGGTRHYYRCFRQCSSAGAHVPNGSFVPVDEVEPAAAAMVAARLVELREELARGPERTAAKAAPDFAGRRAKLDARRARYLEAHGEDLMTLTELRSRLAKLDAERAKVDAEEDAYERENALHNPRARRGALLEVETLQAAWERAPGHLRREIVNRVARAFRLEKGAPPIAEWVPVAELLADR